MPRKPLYVKEWSEDYRGWRIKFRVRARSEDGYLRTEVSVAKTWMFGLLAGRTRYREEAEDWTIGQENLDEQIDNLRQGAEGFIDSVEAMDLSEYGDK